MNTLKEIVDIEKRATALKLDTKDPSFSASEYLSNIPEATFEQVISLLIEGDVLQAGEMLKPHVDEYADERIADREYYGDMV